MKRCNKCKEVKPLTEFSKRPDRDDGRTSHCKKCILEYTYKRMAKIKEARQFNII